MQRSPGCTAARLNLCVTQDTDQALRHPVWEEITTSSLSCDYFGTWRVTGRGLSERAHRIRALQAIFLDDSELLNFSHLLVRRLMEGMFRGANRQNWRHSSKSSAGGEGEKGGGVSQMRHDRELKWGERRGIDGWWKRGWGCSTGKVR